MNVIIPTCFVLALMSVCFFFVYPDLSKEVVSEYLRVFIPLWIVCVVFFVYFDVVGTHRKLCLEHQELQAKELVRRDNFSDKPVKSVKIGLYDVIITFQDGTSVTATAYKYPLKIN